MNVALPIDLDPQAGMLVELVDRVAFDRIAPAAGDVDRDGDVPGAIVDALAELGLLSAGVRELSGADVDSLYGPLVVSRLARVSASVAAVAAAVHDGAAAFGDRDRLAGRATDWVPTVVSAGVTAVPAGDGFELSGRGPRVELGAEDAGLVVLATGPDGAGVVVEIERERDGVRVGERERTTGLRGRTFAALELDAVRVTAADVIGGAADAERARAMRSLTTAALGLGVALGAFEAADRYAGERRQFGTFLRTFPAVRGHLLDMEQHVATAAALLWTATPRHDVAQWERLPALRAARAAVEAAQAVPRLAVQVLGGYGYVEEYGVEVRMRDGASVTARAGGVEALVTAMALTRGADTATGS